MRSEAECLVIQWGPPIIIALVVVAYGCVKEEKSVKALALKKSKKPQEEIDTPKRLINSKVSRRPRRLSSNCVHNYKIKL